MEDIREKIKFLESELGKKENQSKAKQRLLIKQMKEAEQKQLDYSKKQFEEFEEMNRNLEQVLKLARVKALLEDMKQRSSIDQAPNDQEMIQNE
jgi:hypothetical protein